jgi:hypothetical protein
MKERIGNIGRGSHMGAWHQDGLADWLSFDCYYGTKEAYLNCNISKNNTWWQSRKVF